MSTLVYCQKCCELFPVESEDKHPGKCPTCKAMKPKSYVRPYQPISNREKEAAEEEYLRTHLTTSLR